MLDFAYLFRFLDKIVELDKDEVLLIFPKAKEQDIKALRKEVSDTFGKNYV